jgi:hypothetical protein
MSSLEDIMEEIGLKRRAVWRGGEASCGTGGRGCYYMRHAGIIFLPARCAVMPGSGFRDTKLGPVLNSVRFCLDQLAE